MRFIIRGLLFWAILALPLSANAYTDKRVNARNPATLEASLNAMIADLSLREQMTLMEAFFRTAYATDVAEIPYNKARGPWGRGPKSARYPNISATAFVSDGRMDGLDPATAYSVWRADGWSKKESYVRFILAFGEAVDGKSGHEFVATSKSVASSQEAASQQAELAKLEKRRKDYIEELQLKEAQKGACKNSNQEALRENIRNIEEAIAKFKAGQKHDFFARSSGAASLFSGSSCSGHPAVVPYAGGPVNAHIATIQQQSQTKHAQRDKNYNLAIKSMSVERVRDFKVKTRSSRQAQFEMHVDIEMPADIGKPLKRLSYTIIAISKDTSNPWVYFSGRLPALGRSGSTMSPKNLQLFGTISRPGNLTGNKDDYSFVVVLREAHYTDGSSIKLVTNMRDFKDWTREQRAKGRRD